MNRAFISYSIADKDRFVVSRLTSVLQQRGMIVSTSQKFHLTNIDFTTSKTIENSDLFIGVITDQSNTFQRVLNEWEYSNQRRIPNILVVEDTLSVQNIDANKMVRFNRNNIDGAINQVQHKIQSAKTSKSNEDIAKWVLGGAAIIALLSLLGESTSGKR